MSKERPKRNIIQKKYVSRTTSLPYMITDAIALFKFASLVSMKTLKLSSRTVKVTNQAARVLFGSDTVLKVTTASYLNV